MAAEEMKYADGDFKLKYFDARARGEGVRLIFAAANKSGLLDDQRWPTDFSKFPTGGITAAAPDFAKSRDAGELKANMDRAPVLVTPSGVTIGQTCTIERYVARCVGLYGTTPLEGAFIDQVGDHIDDIKARYKTEKGKGDEALAEFWAKGMPDWLGRLEASLGASGDSGFVVGNAVSLADCRLHVFLREFFDNQDGVNAALVGCPKVKASLDALAALPGVVAYLSTRKETAM